MLLPALTLVGNAAFIKEPGEAAMELQKADTPEHCHALSVNA